MSAVLITVRALETARPGSPSRDWPRLWGASEHESGATHASLLQRRASGAVTAHHPNIKQIGHPLELYRVEIYGYALMVLLKGLECSRAGGPGSHHHHSHPGSIPSSPVSRDGSPARAEIGRQTRRRERHAPAESARTALVQASVDIRRSVPRAMRGTSAARLARVSSRCGVGARSRR